MNNNSIHINHPYVTDLQQEPVFVITQGRCGTCTTADIIKELGYHNIVVLHTVKHNLRHNGLDNTPSEYMLGVIERAKNYLKNNKCKIITIFRDQLSRAISSYFWFYKITDNILPTNFIEDFIDNYPHEYALNWIDNHFVKFTGINLLDYSFDINKNFSIINDKSDILCLKIENTDVWNHAFDEFMGIKIGSIGVKNSVRDKRKLELKSYIMKNRSDIVDFYNKSEIMRKFYG